MLSIPPGAAVSACGICTGYSIRTWSALAAICTIIAVVASYIASWLARVSVRASGFWFIGKRL